MLFSGDFRQILPVIPGGLRAQIVHASVMFSALYARFRTLSFTENMRLSSLRNDPNAREAALLSPNHLLHLGEGRLETTEDGMVKVPESVQKLLKSAQGFQGITRHCSVPKQLNTRTRTVFDALQNFSIAVLEDHPYRPAAFNLREGLWSCFFTICVLRKDM